MSKLTTYYTLFLFFIAGIAEIGGGYFIWQAMRGKMPVWMGIIGGIMLAGYGVLASLQPQGFGRTYAAYGGIFVIMSLLWGWYADKTKPDLYDTIGAVLIAAGVTVMYFIPRRA